MSRRAPYRARPPQAVAWRALSPALLPGALLFVAVVLALAVDGVAAAKPIYTVPCGRNGTNTTFRCSRSRLCIPANLTCDGINNCGDNSDEQGCSASQNGWQGFLGAALTALFFGTNLIPVKKFETGDGMFFQWCMCAGIWSIGLLVQVRNGAPQRAPAACPHGSM